MILVDTSVWVDHFRQTNQTFAHLLAEDLVAAHPFIIGEICCGNLRRRAEVRRLLEALPKAKVADHEEVLRLVEERRLWATGMGWVDAHLLASALLTGCKLWTLDQRLNRAASALGVEFA